MLAWISFGFSLARIDVLAMLAWISFAFSLARIDVLGSWGGWESATLFYSI